MGCAGEATQAAATGATVGAVFGSAQAAWAAKPEVGNRTAPLLINTAGKIGRWAAALAGASAVYQGTLCTVKDVRGKDDTVSAFFGGCAAGATAGFKTHRVVDAVSGCAALGAMAAMVKFAGEFRPETKASTLYVEGVQKKLKEGQAVE